LHVLKRSHQGSERVEPLDLGKITRRLELLSKDLDHVNLDQVTVSLSQRITDRIHTTELDELAAADCIHRSSEHPDYGTLAARLVVSNHQKNTEASFVSVVRRVSQYEHHGRPARLMASRMLPVVERYADELEEALRYERDYLFDYMGFTTIRKYLVKLGGVIVERPQHLYLRVAVALHSWEVESSGGGGGGGVEYDLDLPAVLSTYDLLSRHLYTHASPTMFNAGMRNETLASCFLVKMKEDSIEGIFDTLGQCAQISKGAGGLGLSVSNIRATGSLIGGSNGTSDGLVKMLKVFQSMVNYVDQCFEGSTPVYERALGWVPISSVQPCHQVLAEDGHFYEVTASRHYTSPSSAVVAVTHSVLGEPVRVTDQHPLLSLADESGHLCPSQQTANQLQSSLAAGTLRPVYLTAKELVSGDWLAWPCIQQEVALDGWTLDDSRLLGLALSGRLSPVRLDGYAMHEEDPQWPWVRDYLRRSHVPHQPGEGGWQTWTCGPHFPFDRESLGGGVKPRVPAWVHLLPRPHVRAVLHGWCLGAPAGHLSWSLRRDFLLLCAKLGFLPELGPSQLLCVSRCLPYLSRRTDELPSGPYVTYGETLFSQASLCYVDVPDSCRFYDLSVKTGKGVEPSYLTACGLAHNGGGKRKGALAVYLETWHADFFEFLAMKNPHTHATRQASDLFYGHWCSNLFLERCKADAAWTFFSPSEAPGLEEVHGAEFEALYERYEREGRGRQTVRAREVLHRLIEEMTMTGGPYNLLKDKVNAKSNQRHAGTLGQSNLCTEIVEYTSADETAVCTLASLALPRFLTTSNVPGASLNLSAQDESLRWLMDASCSSPRGSPLPWPEAEVGDGAQNLRVPDLSPPEQNHYTSSGADFRGTPLYFDFAGFEQVVRHVVRNLNRTIDINYYPTQEAARSHLKRRPLGLGVQGLADVFRKLSLPYTSPGARELNQDIFETLYYAAVDESCELARVHGSYATFPGSPASQGLLSPDLWLESGDVQQIRYSGRHDFDALRNKVREHGLRNSLLVAPMPTATTSQILGNTESFEPLTSNIFKRHVMAGTFTVINRDLVNLLLHKGQWNRATFECIVRSQGSVAALDCLTKAEKKVFRTVWELKMQPQLEMAQERGVWVDQAMSFNVHMARPTLEKMERVFYKAYELGLKNISYYFRQLSESDANLVTYTSTAPSVSSAGAPEQVPDPPQQTSGAVVCPLDPAARAACESCSA